MYTADSLYKAEEGIKEIIYNLHGVSNKMFEMAERENMLEVIKCINFDDMNIRCEEIDIIGTVEVTIEYCRTDTKKFYAIFELQSSTFNLLRTSPVEFSRIYLAGMVVLNEVIWRLDVKEVVADDKL